MRPLIIRTTLVDGRPSATGNSFMMITARRGHDRACVRVSYTCWSPRWTDLEALKAFAGTEIGRARYFPQDDRFLLTRPEHVQHYEATVPGFKAESG
jgi:hypothetical protein